MANKVKAHWLVSLSNGETAIEGKPPYEEIDGQLSPWQRLIRYVALNKLQITGIRIQVQVDDGPIRTFNLPSKSPKQKFANLKPLLPNHFNYFRRVEKSLKAEYVDNGHVETSPSGDADVHYIEIHAIYNDFELVLIVDEDTGNETWAFILPKN